MSDELNTQLSAFVDNELTPEESELFVRRLCRDETLRSTAASYGIIGNAIRGETAITAPGDFVTSVMMAVEGQTLPAAQPPAVQQSQSIRNWGVALAASAVLGAVALVTLPGSGPDGLDTVIADDTATPAELNLPAAIVADNSQPVQAFSSSRQPGTAMPASLNPAVTATLATNGQTVPAVMPISAERRAQLNNLLLQHLNSSGGSRQQRGLVGFRNVGFVTQTESQR